MRRILCAFALTLLTAVRSSALSPVELITNGNFETGTFAGWTIQDRAGGSGNWSIDVPGTTTPMSAHATAPNALGGGFYAVSDQTGPGTHVLYQSFIVPLNAANVKLSFQMFANDSDGGPHLNPAGLDHTAIPNQQARVDILFSGAAPFSTVGIDTAADLYAGVDPQAGNPNPYKNYNFDLTGIVSPGSTYVLRFGEVDNQLYLNQGVDNVSILVTPVPEPATAAFAVCIALCSICCKVNRSNRPIRTNLFPGQN
jgi:hypothetical protein